jgi:hypothetical protein
MVAFSPFCQVASTALPLLAMLSVCDARVLPKMKRDNSTSCGYTITNRDNAYFKNKYELDFSTVRFPSHSTTGLETDMSS